MPKGQHGDDDAQRQVGKRFDYSITLIWWDSEAMTTATKCEQSTQRAAAKKKKKVEKAEEKRMHLGKEGKKIKEVKRLRQSSVKFILSRHCSYMYVGPRGGGTTGVTVA